MTTSPLSHWSRSSHRRCYRTRVDRAESQWSGKWRAPRRCGTTHGRQNLWWISVRKSLRRHRTWSGRAIVEWHLICDARCNHERMKTSGRSTFHGPRHAIAAWGHGGLHRTLVSCTSCCRARNGSIRLLFAKKWGEIYFNASKYSLPTFDVHNFDVFNNYN